jgi:hypothetical protein
MTFTEKVKLVAFELACNSVFSGLIGEDVTEILGWMSSAEDTQLPDKFKVVAAYIPHSQTGLEVRKIIATTTKVLYDVLVIGAELTIEAGESGVLRMDELTELTIEAGESGVLRMDELTELTITL